MPPPRLTPASADRLTRVVEAADEAVDAGETPDAALAKAARDNALPVGHVPLAVRAFNTGRAVRQLDAGADPWEKAAAYPQASAEGVAGILAGPATKAAAATTDDYLAPPGGFQTEKVAFAPPPAPPPPPAPAAVQAGVYGRLLAAAQAYEKLAALCRVMPPREYAAVKAAALADHPEAAAYAFGRLEHEDYAVGKKAASAPDAAVPTGGHPAVRLVADLASAKAAAAPTDSAPPAGYQKLADEAPGWFVRKPVCDVLGVEIPEKRAAEAPATPPAERPLVAVDPAKAAGAFTSGFGGGFKTVLSPVSALANSKTIGGAVNFRQTPEDAAADRKNWIDSTQKSIGTQAAGDLAQVDRQADLQAVLADPRFAMHDPKLVVETYRQLSGLAPTVMRNPAVAGDFIQRRIQTGPLSSYDLKTLVDMEKGVVTSRQNAATSHGDEDD